MSFLYPRTGRIDRAAHQGSPSAGILPYGGIDQASEATVVNGFPCNVQARGTGRRDAEHLAGDTVPYLWNVNIPLSAGIADGVIRDRDIFTDDLGRRMAVEAAYCHSMGWRLSCASSES